MALGFEKAYRFAIDGHFASFLAQGQRRVTLDTSLQHHTR